MMPQITRIKERNWVNSTFDPKAQKVSFYDGRKDNKGRTLLSKINPGQCVSPQRSDCPWDIFILSGSMIINDKEVFPGDHILCLADEDIAWETKEGCECLVFVRTNHEWTKR